VNSKIKGLVQSCRRWP